MDEKDQQQEAVSHASQEEFSLFSRVAGEYGAAQVQQLEGIDVIRKRPTLFIEDLDTAGLHRLIHEVIDNAFDEAMAGFGNKVVVEIGADSTVSVEDWGRGIPVDTHPLHKLPAVEIVFTKLFAGGKFDKGGYSSAGGLHGVGLKCLTAFSCFIEVDIWREGAHYQMRLENGAVSSPLKKVGSTDRTGTKIKFLPDYNIFKGAYPNALVIEKRLRQDAYLNPGAEAVLSFGGVESVFCYPEGVSAFIDEACETSDPVHAATISLRGKKNDDIAVECHLRFTNSADTSLWGYVNNVHTQSGGSHVQGAVKGLLRAVKSYGTEKKLLRQKTPVLRESDITAGIIAVVNYKTKSPKFTSQTKNCYQDGQAESEISEIVKEEFLLYMTQNQREGKAIVLHCMDNAVSREKATHQKRHLRKLKATASEGIPGSLLNCKNQGDGSELFVFVKTSSWHRLAKCRDTEHQAVLPMPLRRNPPSSRAHLDLLIDHPDYHALVAGLGAGVGGTTDEETDEPLDETVTGNFVMPERRYDKVVLVCDNTPESRLALANVMAFIQKFMTPMVVERKTIVLDVKQLLDDCKADRLSLLSSKDAEKHIFSSKTRQ